MAPSTPSPTRTPITAITTTVIEQKESQKLLTHPVRHLEKQTTPQRDAILDPMQPIDHHLGTEDRKDRIRSSRETLRIVENKFSSGSPKFKQKVQRLHSGAAIERLETTEMILQPIPETANSGDQFKKYPQKLKH